MTPNATAFQQWRHAMLQGRAIEARQIAERQLARPQMPEHRTKWATLRGLADAEHQSALGSVARCQEAWPHVFRPEFIV